MDPLADKLLVSSALICMVEMGTLPAWVVIIIISREFIITGFRLIAAEGGLVIAASWWGKIKTVTQMAMIILLLLGVQGVIATILVVLATLFTVVSGVDLDIEKGKILAFIGPNGSGKSTILKSISKNIPILGGDIVIDGKSIKNYSYKELSKKMAVILTERVKTELMTCWDVVEMGRFPYTGRLGLLSESDELKVKNALEAVNALDIAEKDFNKISDGQRQRILLARAICQEPEIIVLDEPTSFLDIKYKFEVLTILMRMAKEKGITVVMSLHETELARKSADVIAAVSRDGSVKSGSPEEMFDEKEIQKLYGIDKKFLDPVFWQDF